MADCWTCGPFAPKALSPWCMIYVVVIVQVIEDFLLKWNPLWNLVQ